MSQAAAEAKLVSDAIGGDVESLQRLLHVHAAQILAYAEKRLPEPLRDVLEPRDILQDVAQLALAGIGSFRPDGDDAIARWFFTIARNRMAELLRAHSAAKRGGGKRRATFDGSDGSVVFMLEELAVTRRTPSMSAVRHELSAALERAFDQLPGDYHQALRLRYFDGKSIEEIAVAMGRSNGSVQMLCNRGLKLLKEALVSASRFS